eukprot:gene6270-8635_t
MFYTSICIGYSSFRFPSNLNSINRKTSTIKSSNDLFPEWYDMDGCLVLIPNSQVPKGIIHFIGGFLAGSTISLSYAELLNRIVLNDFLVIATPIGVDINHNKLGENSIELFNKCYKNSIKKILGPTFLNVPIFGLSHSLGGKITSIINSRKDLRKSMPIKYANIFLSFNNYDAIDSLNSPLITALTADTTKKIVDSIGMESYVNKLVNNFKSSDFLRDVLKNIDIDDSIKNTVINSASKVTANINNVNTNSFPLDRIKSVFGDSFMNDVKSMKNAFEFTPTANEAWNMIVDGYNIQNNYFIKFVDDEIDQSVQASSVMRQRGCSAAIIELKGNHLTPNYFEKSLNGLNSFRGLESDVSLKDYLFNDESLKTDSINETSEDFLNELIRLLNKISRNAWEKAEQQNLEKDFLFGPPNL